MKLKELVKNLATKPEQQREVDYIVFERESGNIVSLDMEGPATMAIMKALGKHYNAKPKES